MTTTTGGRRMPPLPVTAPHARRTAPRRAAMLAGVLAASLAATALPTRALASTAVRNPSFATADPAIGRAADAPGDYRLGAGDLIRVSVYQNPDLTLEVRLTESGTISFPLIGMVHLGGASTTGAERVVADGLRSGGYVRQPQVSVTLMQARSQQANVLGQVVRPGRYALDTPSLRLSDLLALAGGATPTASDRVVVSGTRANRPFRQEVDLPRLFSMGGHDHDLLIQGGDSVWVDRQPQVYIYGEVQRPGAMRLERGMTLLQALAAGGGPSPRGTERGIRVHRLGGNGAAVRHDLRMDDRLQDGDVIFVKESLF